MEEEIIKKWLNNELSEEELKSFESTKEYKSYVKILDNAKYFKAPEFDADSSKESLDFAITSRTKSNNKIVYQLIASIAAVLIIGFLIFDYTVPNQLENTKTTEIAQTHNITLPDQSIVDLNANSSIDYNEATWEEERLVSLEGEATFNVEKGKKFTVSTNYGTVEVLGTIFNVKSRDYAFQVQCIEGSVKVGIKNENYILKQHDLLKLEKDKVIIESDRSSLPDWKNNLSIVRNETLNNVLMEFQNYYDVEFETSNIDTNKTFTGSFTHQNMEIALNSITLPLGISYKIEGKKVFLTHK